MGFNTPMPQPIDKLDVKDIVKKAQKDRIGAMPEVRQFKTLRMRKINIEDIYPQAEKDREGEKLKKLCDMHETQKNVTADGRALIDRFVKPRKLVKIDA